MKTSTSPGKLNLLFTIPVILLAAVIGMAQESQPFSINNSPLPAPTGFVNDFAGVMDPATKQRLEARLREFKERSNPSAEIAVAVIGTTGGRDIFEYSLAVARGWQIGSKAGDNPSALLLVAIEDRKYFTQVSRDLEDELPDGRVGSLQRQYLVPEFKKGNYSKGIEDTIEAYIAAIENQGGATATPPASGTTPSGEADPPFPTFCCGIIILIILLIIISRSNRSGGTKGGGGSSWGGGSKRSREFEDSGGWGGVLPVIIGAILSGGGSSGGSSFGSWGGNSGGDSGWGGGGGFGGFGGGGDFGGGGAGGDW